MKQMSDNKLTARINKFIDRNRSKMFDMNELSDRKVRRTHGQHADVSDTPFIALAIR